MTVSFLQFFGVSLMERTRHGAEGDGAARHRLQGEAGG